MSLPSKDRISPPQPYAPRLSKWRLPVLLAIYAACGTVFFADITLDTPVAAGVFYVPIVWAGSLFRSARALWLFTALAIVMTVVGFFLPMINRDVEIALVNRALSIASIVITALFIAEQRRNNARMAEHINRAENANLAKIQLLHDLNHEVRTPLNAILGFTELLQSGTVADSAPPLAVIRDSGHRMLRTLENLVDLTAADDRRLEVGPVDLGGLLSGAVLQAQSSAQARGVGLHWVPPAQAMPNAMGNAWAVQRIVGNLVDNALKYTQPGGTVSVRLAVQKDVLAAEIVDTGYGIPPALLERLGEPFFQVDNGMTRRVEGGLGAGLAVCVRLAAEIGSRLHIASEIDRGTTVTLLVPIAA